MDGPTQTAKELKEPSDMDGPTQTAKELKEPSDMDGSTKELKTDSTVEELKNGSPVRRSLALFLGIFALFSLGGYAARVVAARADATILRLHAVPDFELIDVLTLPTNPRLFARLFNSAHLHGLPSDGAPTTLPVDFRPEPAAAFKVDAAISRSVAPLDPPPSPPPPPPPPPPTPTPTWVVESLKPARPKVANETRASRGSRCRRRSRGRTR